METKAFDISKMSEHKKAEAFDKIADMFYKQNFGTTSKSEIELLMFSFFMDEMIEKYSDENGVLDYRSCSDLTIAKTLGLTPERVHTLKEKKQMRYPVKFDWRDSLKKISDSVRYENGKINIPVSDPNLYNEISNFIETNGGYIEIQRGKNLIKIRPEYYFMLLYMDCDENDKKKIQREMAKEFKKRNEEFDIDSIKTMREFKDNILKIASNNVDLLAKLAKGVVSPLLSILVNALT